MPFSGGVFTRIYNWVTDKNNSINITASRMDTEMDGMATGLSTCILKDGTQTITANIPFSNFKITNLGSGTALTDAAIVGQVQNQTFNWIAAGGTSDAITATYSPAVAALVDGMELDFRATAANITTTPTFSPSGLTAHTITQNGGSVLPIGAIPAALYEGKLRYNLANTRWELMNPFVVSAPFSDATAIVKGSSDATKLFRIEVDGNTTGTTRVMTPPDSDFTAVGASTTQTLSNKTFQDSTCTFIDDGDATKKLAFMCNGISTGTTRTVTIQDVSGTMALQGANVQSTPANPTGTSSTTGVMMGLASSITPSTSGRLLIIISGSMTQTVSSDGAKWQIRYGTGATPTNGAALTGTTSGAIETNIATNNGPIYAMPSLNAFVTGLTVGTAYWIDVSLAAVTGGTASLVNISVSAIEL